MKIVCISASDVPSSKANSIQVMKVCQALGDLGHAVTLLVPGHPNQTRAADWDQLQAFYGLQSRFEVEWLPAQPALKRYDFALAAVQRAQQLGARLVYVWPPQAAWMALALRMPVIFELHGEPEGKLGPLVFRWILQLKGKKRFLPITQALADYLARQYRYTFGPGEVVVAPNGVDLARYQGLPTPAEARQALGLAEGFTAGYTGHLYPGRGMNLLVELAQTFSNVQFLWVGGHPEGVSEWRARLAQAGLANVTLTGFVENSRLPLYQAAADVLLMPYERQIAGSSGGNSADFCSPMKMFEYMACGRAIISSDLPVIGEVLNSQNAVLCPPENTPIWGQALEQLRVEPAARMALGERARQDAQQYTWERRAARALEGF